MHRIGIPLLLGTCACQAWAAGDRIAPLELELEQQIKHRAEQASKTLPSPSDSGLYRMQEREAGMGREHGVTTRPSGGPSSGLLRMQNEQGPGGYGQGYERRYGSGGGMPSGSAGRGGRR